MSRTVNFIPLLDLSPQDSCGVTAEASFFKFWLKYILA